LYAGSGKREKVAIEVEKKFRLTKQQREAVLERLAKIGSSLKANDFEENVLYEGNQIDLSEAVLRLRRVGEHGFLTFKQRAATTSAIKYRQEDETQVADADAMDAILRDLGFTPALVYEKRRMTWELGDAEILVDDLPFGLFMEIEGPEAEINDIEQKLDIKDLQVEHATYPTLTRIHGKKRDGLIEARFD